MINTTSKPNKENIQGLIIKGYTHPYSTHLLFKFNNANGVPAFMTGLMPYLRTAERWLVKPAYMLNIGLTWGGVSVIKPSFVSRTPNFPGSFVVGPACKLGSSNLANPQLSLNDTGPSAPATWWGNTATTTNFNTTDVHCVVHAYALTPDAMDTIMQHIAAAVAASNGSVTELFPLKNDSSAASGAGRLVQSQLATNYIQFGYRDGIDEPELSPAIPETDPSDLSYFVVGYDAACNTQYGAVPSPTTGPEGTFAADGCYNAFRLLAQDVGAFEGFLDEHAPKIAPLIPPEPNTQFPTQISYAREWLAGKLNGRWRDGTPMQLSDNKENPKKVEVTDFVYDDSQGVKCPFAAHTRVANPRNDNVIPLDVPVPRIIRRGVPYGPPFAANNANASRGLIGLFLCGDLSTQFEKIYSWMNFNNFSTVFPGVPGAIKNTQDALVANRQPQPGSGYNPIDPSFTIPLTPFNGGPSSYTIDKLPQFVSTVGTAYCLLPSRKTLQAIADGTI